LALAAIFPIDQTTAKPFQLLYSFGSQSNFADGAHPQGLVADKAGNLYGVASSGGPNEHGAIYRLAPDGTETVLYSFGGADFPNGGLARDRNGNLFGSTGLGGAFDGGIVFKLATDGSLKNLHYFGDGSDGSIPNGDVVLDHSGNIYGTTYAGGAHDRGTVFRIDPGGTETVLYSFSKTTGSHPVGGLLLRGGDLFGTTYNGGNDNCFNGCGLVFKLGADGSEQTLYAFSGIPDGAHPQATLVADSDGSLYGATSAVGTGDNQGTIFKIAPDGTASRLHAFTGAEGANPVSVILDKAGNLYGTAFAGGHHCPEGHCGTVFALPQGGDFAVLHYFSGDADGAEPNGLVMKKGRLFGTTQIYGPHDGGTIFAIRP